MKVFISYSRRNTELTNKIVDILKEEGFEPWMDTEELQGGDKWEEKIKEAVHDTKGFIIVLSPQWLESEYCHLELTFALNEHKKIIPILIEDTKIPKYISQYQHLDFRNIEKDINRKQKFYKQLERLKTFFKEASNKEQTNKARSSATKVLESHNRFNWIFFSIGAIISVFALIPLYLGLNNSGPCIDLGICSSPKPTSVPSPTPFLGDDFDVIVAGFAYQDGDIVVNPSDKGLEIQHAVERINSSMDMTLNELKDSSDGIGSVLTRKDLHETYAKQLYILGDTAEERELHAQELAELYNADLVIYGVITSVDGYYVFSPEIFLKDLVTRSNGKLEPDILDDITPIFQVRLRSGSVGKTTEEENFKKLAQIILYFVEGYKYFIDADYVKAQIQFENAINIEIENCSNNNGIPLLYIYAGNSALRQNNLEEALNFFNQALELETCLHEPPRALVGRGLVLWLLVRERYEAFSSFSLNFDPDGVKKVDCYAYPEAIPVLMTTYQSKAVNLPPDFIEKLYQVAHMSFGCLSQAILEFNVEESDTGIKAYLGRGQLYLWLAQRGSDSLSNSKEDFCEVTSIYENASIDRQENLEFLAGHAYGGLGIITIEQNPNSQEEYKEAINLFNKSIDLLSYSIETKYNEEAIETYSFYISMLSLEIEKSNLSEIANDVCPK